MGDDHTENSKQLPFSTVVEYLGLPYMAASILSAFETLSADAPRKDFRHFIVLHCISLYVRGMFMVCSLFLPLINNETIHE